MIITVDIVLQNAVTLLTVDPAQRPIGQGQGQGQGQPRKVSIEMYSHPDVGKRHHKNRANSFSNLDLVSRSYGDLPRCNLSTSMTLLDLREGMFTAQIPLSMLSADADVTVKVIDSSLELYVSEEVKKPYHKAKTGQRSNESRYRGTIDLPNYVDSERVQFDVVGQSLRMIAAMKGCGGQTSPLSVSNVNKSSSTLDLTRIQRREDSTTKRRKSANDVNVSSVRDKVKNTLCL